MRRDVVLIGAALAIASCYVLALAYAVNFAINLSFPRWWLSTFGSSGTAVLSWSSFSHTVTVFAVSVPFAWLIARLYGKSSIPVAAGIGAATWLYFEAYAVYLIVQSPKFLTLWFADTLAFAVALPCLVLVLVKVSRSGRHKYEVRRPGE